MRGLLAGTAVLVHLLLAGCVQPKTLPVLGRIPEFQLTSQSGQPFDSRSLDGHVWVADFIYSTCTGPCPTMSSDMRRLQASTAEMPGVKLVSFTVDPAHDTPQVLADYAKHFKAEPGRWFFLTGDQSRLSDLGLNGFHLNTVDGSLLSWWRLLRLLGFRLTMPSESANSTAWPHKSRTRSGPTGAQFPHR